MNGNWKRSMAQKPVLFVIAAFMAVLFAGQAIAQSQRDSLAQTPPMGWNSWNKFACNVSEDLIKSVADAMATNGMKEAGYQLRGD